jgi:hypothetical protein
MIANRNAERISKPPGRIGELVACQDGGPADELESWIDNRAEFDRCQDLTDHQLVSEVPMVFFLREPDVTIAQLLRATGIKLINKLAIVGLGVLALLMWPMDIEIGLA